MYLLDTHTLLWALTDPDKLGAQARRVILDRSTILLVSAASAWEVSTKVRLGRLPGARPLVSTWQRNLTRLGVQHLAITDEHALLCGSLDWGHADPFDRMLAAQAIIESVPLLSRDRAFDSLPAVECLW
ncbi:MAG TPA: type II toxin-antitoxin system VapC family toxin [Beutenbergiaceae bacterium]|nr:type II toxin-antitoxin system VapC family toxin [Beutenbergiaceae bacterium]